MYIRFVDLKLKDYIGYDFVDDIARTLNIPRDNIVLEDIHEGSIIIKFKILSDNIVPVTVANDLIQKVENGDGKGLLDNATNIVFANNLVISNTEAYLDLDENTYTIDLITISNEKDVTYEIYNFDAPFFDSNLISLKGTILTVKSGYRGITYDLIIRIQKRVKFIDWILHVTEKRLIDLSKVYRFPDILYLDRIPSTFELDKYFVATSANAIINYEVVPDLSNVVLTTGKHNNQYVFQYRNNAINIYPEYRNTSYSIYIKASIDANNYIEYNLNIIEIDFPIITLKNSNLISFTSDFEYDVASLFNDYPYSLNYIVSYDLFDINKARTSPDLSIINSLVTFKQDFRGQEYVVTVTAYDVLYESQTKKTYNVFSVREKAPLIKNYEAYSLDNLSNVAYVVDLRPLFTNYTKNNINYNLLIEIDSNINNEQLSSFVYQLNSSNIVIEPDFRDASYDFKIDSFITGYEKQHVVLDIAVREQGIPKNIIVTKYLNVSSSLKRTFTYNLDNYTIDYVLYEPILYYCNVDLTKDYNIIGNTLNISVDFRDVSYDVVIGVKDRYKSYDDIVIFNVTEFAPIYVLRDSVTFNNLQNIPVLLDLNTVFQNNTLEQPFYIIDISNDYASFISSNIDAYGNSVIYIIPDYREISYSFNVSNYILNHENQIFTSTIFVSEMKLPDVSIPTTTITIDRINQISFTYDLRSYLVSYIDDSLFEPFTFTSNYISNKSYYIQTSNLIINTDYRNAAYIIEISLTDKYRDYPNLFYFYVTELPPFYKLNDLDVLIPPLKAEQYTIANLSSYYAPNVTGGILNYSIALSNIEEDVNKIAIIRDYTLTISPRYRNINYQIILIPYVNGYEWYRPFSNILNVTEEQNPLATGTNNIVYDLILSNQEVSRDLRTELLLDSTFNLFSLYNISSNIQLNSDYEACNRIVPSYSVLFNNIDQKITFQPKYIGRKYSLQISFTDKIDPTFAIVLLYNVDELPPVDSLLEISKTYNNLTNQTLIFNLNEYFTGTNLRHNFTYRMNANTIGYHNKIFFYNVANNVLFVHPDYRGDTYYIDMVSYSLDYTNQRLSNTLTLIEKPLPLLEFTQATKNLNGLTIYNITCNLNNISSYNIYPYKDTISYEIYTTYAKIQDRSNLVITPNLRNISYDIYVKIYDTNITQSSCNLLFKVVEKPPLEKINEFPVIPILSPPSYTFSIAGIYKNNHDLSNLTYDLSVSQNNIVAQLINNNSDIIIYTQYRGIEYDLILKVNVVNYETFKLQDTIHIIESNDPNIGSDKSYNIDLLSFNQYEKRYLQTDLGYSTAINLYDRYNIAISWNKTAISYPSIASPTCNLVFNTGSSLESHVLNLYGRLLGYSYNIQLDMKDKISGETQVVLRYHVFENPPISRPILKETLISIPMPTSKISCNLSDYFISNFISCNINYTFQLSNITRFQNYYDPDYVVKINDLNISDGSVYTYAQDYPFTLTSEYRGSYNIVLTAIMQSFEAQSNVFIIDVQELPLPILNLSLSSKSLTLTTERYECNLYNDFNIASYDYYFKESLVYGFNITAIQDDLSRLNSVKNNVQMSNTSNLIIDADLNNIRYNIEYFVKDDFFVEIFESNNIIITERAPLEIIADVSKDYSVQSESSIDLNRYYNKNRSDKEIVYEISSYSLSASYVKNVYSNQYDAAFISGSKIVLLPDYRGQTYSINISSYLNGYDYYKDNLTLNITEQQLPSIVLKSSTLSYDSLYNAIYSYDIRDLIEYVFLDKIVYNVIQSNCEMTVNNNGQISILHYDVPFSDQILIKISHAFRDITNQEILTIDVAANNIVIMEDDTNIFSLR